MAVSLPGVGSVVVEETVAELLMRPTDPGVTTISMVKDSLAVMGSSVQVTVPPASRQSSGGPRLAVADTNPTDGGGVVVCSGNDTGAVGAVTVVIHGIIVTVDEVDTASTVACQIGVGAVDPGI